MTTEVAEKKAKMAPEPCCNCGHLPDGQDTIPTRRDAFRPEVSVSWHGGSLRHER